MGLRCCQIHSARVYKMLQFWRTCEIAFTASMLPSIRGLMCTIIRTCTLRNGMSVPPCLNTFLQLHHCITESLVRNSGTFILSMLFFSHCLVLELGMLWNKIFWIRAEDSLLMLSLLYYLYMSALRGSIIIRRLRRSRRLSSWCYMLSQLQMGMEIVVFCSTIYYMVLNHSLWQTIYYK